MRQLKAEDGGHIVHYGFGDVSRTLLDAGLIDELQMWIHPQLVGPADTADLLSRPGVTATFDLAATQVLANGIIVATYRP